MEAENVLEMDYSNLSEILKKQKIYVEKNSLQRGVKKKFEKLRSERPKKNAFWSGSENKEKTKYPNM